MRRREFIGLVGGAAASVEQRILMKCGFTPEDVGAMSREQVDAAIEQFGEAQGVGVDRCHHRVADQPASATAMARDARGSPPAKMTVALGVVSIVGRLAVGAIVLFGLFSVGRELFSPSSDGATAAQPVQAEPSPLSIIRERVRRDGEMLVVTDPMLGATNYLPIRTNWMVTCSAAGLSLRFNAELTVELRALVAPSDCPELARASVDALKEITAAEH